MRKWADTGAFQALNQLTALSGNISRINPKVTVDTQVGIQPKVWLILGGVLLLVFFMFKKKKGKR
jgi:hypothetical protein